MQISVFSPEAIEELSDKSAEKAVRLVLKKLPNDDSPDWDWISNRECTRLTGFSKSTTQRYRESGRLPFSKVGGNIFYRRSDLEDLLERNIRTVSEQVPA